MEPEVKWLLFEAFDDEDQPVLTNFAQGQVSDVNGELILVANRVGMAPGDHYKTQLIITANGAEQERRIDVQLEVADIVGDYEMTVRLDEIDQNKADLHNPTYFLSFARDGKGVKAFLDEERSLLIPETTYLSGEFFADPQSHFQVLGQIYMDANHESNPYNKPIRREFTLTGQRSDGRDGLSPLDLKGQYRESIYGIVDDPIQIQGEFVGRRLSPIPKKQDAVITDTLAGDIVASDDNGGVSTFSFDVNDQLSITDIKAALKINHSSPESLTIRLTSPAGTTLTLHDKETRSLTELRFDDYDQSIDDMDTLNGELAFGTWQLSIINASETIGQLQDWHLEIQGARVYSIKGTTDAGMNLQLTGCGVVQNTTTNTNGHFSFEGLIPCDYEIAVVQLGYDVSTTTLRLIGCPDQTDPEKACTRLSDFTRQLSSSQLVELKPRLKATSNHMQVVVSPKNMALPKGQDRYGNPHNIQLQAVDITHYASMGRTLSQRHWALYKLANSWTVINNAGYLVEMPAHNGQVPAGNNYIAHSEKLKQKLKDIYGRSLNFKQ